MVILASSGSPTGDRGILHQILFELGVSDSTAHTVQIYAIGPLRILLVVVVALVLARLVTKVSRRLVKGLRIVSPLVRHTQRGEDRIKTLAGVFASVFRAAIWVVAVLTILGELSINLIPFVATATVIGAALGFGAQSLVKDYLSGVLIVAEDQYQVGDHIVVGNGPNATSGTVEGVNLRVTRLRSLDGVVWYVPNGDIRTVGNDTETDSQALVDVLVPPGTDLTAAAESAKRAAMGMAAEPAWKDVFVGQPSFAGIQTVDNYGATLRIIAPTRPGQHFQASRELRLRILEQLRRDGVAWAQPRPEPT